MGCKNTRLDSCGDGTVMSVHDEWTYRNLPVLTDTAHSLNGIILKFAFENDQEAVLFKTINLIRHNPAWTIPFIKKLRSHKKYTGANIELVMKRVRELSAKTLPLLEVSVEGVNVCRKVNEDLKDNKYPNCSRLRKLYRDTYNIDSQLTPSPSNVSGKINTTSCCLPTEDESIILKSYYG